MRQATRDELRGAPGMTKARARATATRKRCEECGGRHDTDDCPELWGDPWERGEDYGGALGADGNVYSDADPGL